MNHMTKNTVACPLCGEEHPAEAVLPGAVLPDDIAAVVRENQPDWTTDDSICADCAREAEQSYYERFLTNARGALSAAEREIVESLKHHALMTSDMNAEFERMFSAGERFARRITDFIGSWRFLGAVMLGLALWVFINVLLRPFEPYPLIVLIVVSTVLATLAALEGPVILMTQRRQRQRDRVRDENAYRVNLKAELEIRYLSLKVDQLLKHNHDVLLEIRRTQDELQRTQHELRAALQPEKLPGVDG